MNRNEIIGAARKAGMAFHMGMPHESVIEQLTRFAEIVLSNSPAWRDAPTVPGLWLNSINGEARQISTANIDGGAWHKTGARWYGPIPESQP